MTAAAARAVQPSSKGVRWMAPVAKRGPVGGGGEPVVRLEAAREVVLVRPADGLPDAGDGALRASPPNVGSGCRSLRNVPDMWWR